MDKRLGIALIVIVIAVVAGFLLFQQQEPTGVGPVEQPSDGAPSASPFPNVSPVQLPPPIEATANIQGRVTRKTSNGFFIEVVAPLPSPLADPSTLERTTYDVRVSDNTIMRVIILAAGGGREEKLTLSDINVGDRFTVIGLQQEGTNVIEAQSVQATRLP